MRNAVGLLFGICFLCACSAPVGPIAGGELDGTVTPWPDDWAFLDEIENVLLQTRPEDPYSVTIWAVRLNDEVFVAAAEADSNWVENIRQDPNVVLKVKGMLYPARARIITSNEESARIVQAYVEKYEYDSEEDFVREEGLLFQLHER